MTNKRKADAYDGNRQTKLSRDDEQPKCFTVEEMADMYATASECFDTNDYDTATSLALSVIHQPHLLTPELVKRNINPDWFDLSNVQDIVYAYAFPTLKQNPDLKLGGGRAVLDFYVLLSESYYHRPGGGDKEFEHTGFYSVQALEHYEDMKCLYPKSKLVEVCDLAAHSFLATGNDALVLRWSAVGIGHIDSDESDSRSFLYLRRAQAFFNLGFVHEAKTEYQRALVCTKDEIVITKCIKGLGEIKDMPSEPDDPLYTTGQWTPVDVRKWVVGFGEHYSATADRLFMHSIDGRILKTLTDTLLISMGVVDSLIRHVLLEKIKQCC